MENWLIGLYNFPLLYHVASTAGIMIAFAVFLVVWNADKYVHNNFLLLFGIATLFIGSLDFLHCMAIMGIYQEQFSNVGSQIWQMTRLLEACAFIIALFYKNKAEIINKYVVLFIYALLTVGILTFSNKIEADLVCYSACLLLVVAGLYLYKDRAGYGNSIYNLLFYSIISMLVSDILIVVNLEGNHYLVIVGQSFRVLSFYLIYKAVIVKAIREPYELIFREVKEKEQQLLDQYELLKTQVNIDGLTGLYNHRYLYEQLSKEKKHSDRSKQKFSIIMMDLDKFKLVNDLHGHLVGDEILKEVSKIIKNNTRETDTVGRYGGEEFLVILPETDVKEAFKVAEKMRIEIENKVFIKGIRITISGGLIEYLGEDISALLAAADKRLYLAKEQGRNKNVM